MNLCYGRCYTKKLNNLDLRTISTKHYELRSEKRKGGEGSWGWEGKVLRMGGWLGMGGQDVEDGRVVEGFILLSSCNSLPNLA